MNSNQHTNKWFLFKDKTAQFCAKSVDKLECYNMPADKLTDKLLFITVAYNNATVIKHQIRLVKKNITDKYFHIVADNSAIAGVREEIKNLCINNNVGYVSLHKNPFSTGSDSHAIVLNWAFKQLILKYQPKNFGFIDHDIYPVKPHALGDILNNQPFYGLLQERANYWYLWPGFCFFSNQIYLKNNLDFMPGTSSGVPYDTAGAIYNSVYHNFDKAALKFPTHTYGNIREGEVVQSDKMEIIDNWIHTFNGSYWMKVKDKEDILNKVLNDFYNC